MVTSAFARQGSRVQIPSSPPEKKKVVAAIVPVTTFSFNAFLLNE